MLIIDIFSRLYWLLRKLMLNRTCGETLHLFSDASEAVFIEKVVQTV